MIKKLWQEYQKICKHRWFRPYVNEEVSRCLQCGLTNKK